MDCPDKLGNDDEEGLGHTRVLLPDAAFPTIVITRLSG